MRQKRGQSTLEYILLVTVIIGALILIASDTGGLRTAIENVFNRSGDKVDQASTLLTE